MSDDRYDAHAIKLLRDDSVKQEGLAGLYRGIVESIDDPDRLGRARVRVFAIHGDSFRTATTALPWAEVSEIGGGGYDFGSFNPPPVGSTVFVMFEMGHAAHPVVMGTWRGIPERDDDNPHIMLTKDNLPTSEKPWKPPNGENETPKDVFDGVFSGDSHPTRRVWQKSYKGHTFIIEDGDGKEFLKIIDRAGQIIVMDCPVEETYGEANKSQRGARDAMRGDQLPHQIMRQRRASIRIRDLSGQEILLDAVDQSERVVIRSKARGSANENKVVLSSGKGKEGVQLVDMAGNEIKLDPNGDLPIQLRDKSGNAILFDKEKGQIQIVAAKEQVANLPRESKVVQGIKKSEIRGDEQKKIHGNKKTDIVGDLAAGILNNIATNVGGAIQLVVVNAPGGVPAPTGDAIDISVTQGNTHLNHLLGDILFDTKVGDVELSTLAGDASLLTLLGDVDVGNLLASANYSSTGGILAQATTTHELDGLTVHLGTKLTALNPMIKTLSFIPAWSAATQALTVAAAAAQASVAALPIPNPISNLAAIISLTTALQAYGAAMAAILVPGNPSFFSIKAFNA